ncbi:MAG: NAD(P)-dependent oxidoreductase [Candidatus Zapsychrus exili]|nr:NAD(P)-dependent oxidoreductase [Candidatus Zapsychrus exili]
MLDVMFYEVFKEEEIAIKKYLPSNIKADFTFKTIQASGDADVCAKIISIRTQSIVPLNWANSLKGILSRSQGYDHLLDYKSKIDSDIVCGYLDKYCSFSVAEHAIILMMMLFKNIKKQLSNFDTFKRDDITGVELRNKNVLVVGVGSIGSEIASIAQALKMNVQGVDIDKKLECIKYVALEDGIADADIVFCALPLTKETDGILNYQSLNKAKEGLIFVNIARGEISPMKDLKKLLDEGILGGLGLDVYEQEQTLASFLRDNGEQKDIVDIVLELKGKDNCLFTPHNAFNTQEALDKKASFSAQAIVEFLKDGKFPRQL